MLVTELSENYNVFSVSVNHFCFCGVCDNCWSYSCKEQYVLSLLLLCLKLVWFLSCASCLCFRVFSWPLRYRRSCSLSLILVCVQTYTFWPYRNSKHLSQNYGSLFPMHLMQLCSLVFFFVSTAHFQWLHFESLWLGSMAAWIGLGCHLASCRPCVLWNYVSWSWRYGFWYGHVFPCGYRGCGPSRVSSQKWLQLYQ